MRTLITILNLWFKFSYLEMVSSAVVGLLLHFRNTSAIALVTFVVRLLTNFGNRFEEKRKHFILKAVPYFFLFNLQMLLLLLLLK